MKRATIPTLALVLAPRLAAAAEGGGNNPFAGDVGTALWTLIIFVLVIWVLGKFAWGPVLDGLQSREAFIRDSLEQAREDREAAEARLKEYTERLEAARAEASEIVGEGRRDAEAVKQRIEDEAREESERMVARARREIELAKEGAVRELYSVSARLATDVAERVIRRELSAEDQQRLISEAIAELEELDRD